MKPLLFLTGTVPAYRAGALAALHEAEGIEVALFGGSRLHGGPEPQEEMQFPHRRVTPAGIWQLAVSGEYRGVVCPTGGRLALLAGWAGARRSELPLILWASLWAHPRSLAHGLSYLPLRHLYRSADAVVTYGPHVSAYVTARGARNVHVAPQSVDNDFWRSGEASPLRLSGAAEGRVRFLFVGRDAPEKGLGVLREAWPEVARAVPEAELILAGPGPAAARGAGTHAVGELDPRRLRDLYAACDVLVVPSIPTPTFREPWGLVVNEAMNRSLAVIASDAVGAAAGGLLEHDRTGIVVGAGERAALTAAMVRLAGDRELRARLGEAGARAVLSYSHEAWAAGFSRALGTVGLARDRW